MGLDIGSLKATGVHAGGVPATGVYVGSEKIWPTGPRVVTLQVSAGRYSSASGDLSLLNEITSGKARFTAPVTCSNNVWVNGIYASAGGRINAGAAVEPIAATPNVFTEIL